MTKPTAKDVKEVKGILKELKKEKDKPCPKLKDLKNWDLTDLNSYIKHKTKGMTISKKIKFAAMLDKKIKTERKKWKKEDKK